MKLTLTNWSTLFLLISIALQALAEDLPYMEYKKPIFDAELFQLRLKEVLPPDAAEYINNFRSCQHWGGEEPYDDERANQISEAIKSSCTGLDDKEKLIKAKYPAGSKESVTIQSIIKEIKSGEMSPSFIFDDPLRKSAALNQYYESWAQWNIRGTTEQIKEYLATVERIKGVSGRAPKNLIGKAETERTMLNDQQKILDKVMRNADRLHPITLEEIKRIQSQFTKFPTSPH